MKVSMIALSALALAGLASGASAVGVPSWDDAASLSTERELPVLLELGTEW